MPPYRVLPRLLVLFLLLGACGGSDAQSGPQSLASDSSDLATDSSAQPEASLRRARIVDLAAGEQHTIAVLDDGSVWTWGLSGNGQLGREVTIDDYWRPRPVAGVRGQLVAAGGATSYVFDGENLTGENLWSAGYNPLGYLGYGPTADEDRFTARPFPLLTDLDAWGSTTLALLADSTLLTWGAGESGQLGTGTTTPVQVEPVPVPELERVIAISVGSGFSMVLLRDGTVRTWGVNGYGTLGVSGIPSTATTTTTSTSPEGDVTVSAPTASAAMYASTPQEPDVDEVVAIAAGGGHALVVREDGTVWGWGANQRGALAQPDEAAYFLEPFQIEGLSDVVAVAAGTEFSLALKADGSLWMWGFINGMYSYEEPYHRIRRVPGLGTISKIEAGHHHAFAVSEDGRVWGWGLTDQGQIGAEGTGSDVEWPPLPVRFTP